MKNKIELNRRRIALAYLDFCQRHFGGKWSDVVVTKKKVVRVDLTQECIEALMKEFIENMVRAEFGITGGQEQIAKSYDAMLSKDRSRLTPLGKSAMEEALIDAVAYKLNNPSSQLLQVVA
ncbi:hypothetical protein [Serratia ficaria]|uniref:hypothetical protein n=1 Tax=Serratia ficaria TaxID=61651 RepID=UPI000E24249C|nr:hypothetical protein [Serratia ficaria]REF42118.1 hypothetical protein C7332_0284 [Serratia ficaria]CAI1046662.1 Uncharacterised protein [Serratia ficaria]CAI1104474.1 Uncharacterised protein [Serratia ficaria]CAI1174357.1 Uncharacterised protein [Serratia ficaria]CAI1199454.1 Uncharacterised protein [Serratia ficaria]